MTYLEWNYPNLAVIYLFIDKIPPINHDASSDSGRQRRGSHVGSALHQEEDQRLRPGPQPLLHPRPPHRKHPHGHLQEACGVPQGEHYFHGYYIFNIEVIEVFIHILI